MPRMKYRGDRSADYHHETRLGLVGKVVGPNVAGEWFIVTSADYDAETDTTYATAEHIARPESAFARLMAAGGLE